ncbi:transcription factor-like 5 protein isoform X3 [Mesoplodon densirostris]|uniref:transcription factor-like 5 protein isoform X3 n=1 Tax=Mesoplodon densirostris TaxID=48708 RepID=UPI0028DBD800|nr:transcription factor-like 5 protein isoform X3 [Mesoplodon densirostris]
MSGPEQPETPQAGGPAGPEGADAAVGEAGLSFTTTDLSLVEMTEVEYTQLQHILYSHMEAVAADGELETRLNSAFLAAAAPGAASGDFAAAGGAASGGVPPVYPVLCPPALADGGFAGANQCLGHIDFQELRMMLLSEAGAPPAAEKTPGADGPGAGATRPKAADGAGKENVEGAPEARAKSAVRVRLEDRFNSIAAESSPAPRGADPPEPGMALNKRRIRICCDELNLLVPFCNAETDKATTLQWTTAFLKYIQETHGDSLKKEFESVFCGKTGRRLKLTRPDSLVTCPTQESQSSPAMEIK